MKCPKCNVEMYNNCCMRCGYMPNGNQINSDNQIDGIGQLSNEENKEQEQKAAYKDYIDSTKEYRKYRKKKIFIIMSVIILVISFIKIKFGTIEIGNPFYYPDHKVLLYDVKVNDTSISTDNTTIHKIPIIPFLVNFNSVSLYQTDIKEGLKREYYVDDSSNFILNIIAYGCYSEKVKGQIKCDSLDYNRTLKEKKNIKYTHLYIQRNDRNRTVIYDGKFMSDITQYIKEKGRYGVEITTQYGLAKTNLYFDIVNK